MHRLPNYGSPLSLPFDSLLKTLFNRNWLDLEPLDIRLDVDELADRFVVCADLPGVNKEDIDIRVCGNQVHIHAEIKADQNSSDADGRAVRRERCHGMLTRTLYLSQDLDDTRAEASFDAAVLRLQLPKKQSTEQRRVDIR
ncbi:MULTISPECIES: Hsp20/alpha crystallin family protein [unclassified Undibacterium]|uniref:Hsp20/alpha crystallin family protein n=1 Tax=unclassified Undibacterium TaxID=2630295 RepID=UPI002AC8D776|nr:MULTISPECIES: Hsp20/alpha crystallin family protein [unclassified Undibacterium]MEB0140925.1 Hsp20/alpha crystallin family protein [Undibacterium sp. CCC2.1]MEB0173158.1 Hsp20/alpha crystallin family protein [Undibacterium sp. CCC1.1]MEB0177880.1 Hsp20/alpha crystallin family protein [Undibacterium sp. CCC3.4]MEB0216135.1 Hsp20/alpha crystallin family protein [Undibacterium sp. 5I2]WPX42816.1 Hsp20/alpha crystallin family protein [Undibacterium sp. CCC3.4]